MGNLLKAVRRVTRYMTEDEDDFVKLNIKAENDDERKKILDVLEDFADRDDSDLKFTVDEDDDKSIEVEVPKDQVEEVSKALDKACPGAKCEAEDDDEDKKEESEDDADPDDKDKEKNESVRDFLTRRRLSESKRRKKNEDDDSDDEEDKKEESDSDDDDEDDKIKESRRKKRRNEDDDEYSDDELEESKRRKKSKKNEDDDEDDIEDPVEEDDDKDSDNDEEDKKEEAEEDEKDKETVEESIKTILKSLKLTEAEAVGIRAIFLEAVETVASRKISRYIRKAQVTENRRIRTATNHLKEDINKYLTYAAKTWVKDNYVPLREGIESQFVSKALDGIKSMLSESNITTPTGKASIEQMKIRLTATEKQLHEAMIALKTRDKDISELQLTRLVESIASKFDMTDSERVRFAKLAKTQRVDECTEESLGAIATLICEGAKASPSKDKTQHLKEETSSKARYIDYLSKPYSE